MSLHADHCPGLFSSSPAVIANMHGESPEAVATLLMQQEGYNVLTGVLRCLAYPHSCLFVSFPVVIANMRGESPEAVATLLMQQEGLRGLQGPTISPVYTLDGSSSGAAAKHGFYACVICVAKKNLYPSVKALQKVGGGCVFVDSNISSG
jgi:hypothetical protein